MTRIQWTGAIDGDLAKTGNYNPAQLPINGDELIFNTGSVDVDTNLAQLGAVNLATFVRTGDYAGALGSDSGAMEVGNVTELIIDGGADTWLDTGLVTELILADGLPDENMAHIDGTISLATCLGGAGTLTFADGSALAALEIAPSAVSLSVIVGTSVGGFTLAEIGAGRCTFNTVAATIRAWNQSEVTINPDAGDITTLLDVRGRALCRHLGNGTLTKVSVRGPQAIFDHSRNTVPGLVTCIDSEVIGGGLMDLRNGLDNFDRTNATKIRGGQILHDHGAEVA